MMRTAVLAGSAVWIVPMIGLAVLAGAQSDAVATAAAQTAACTTSGPVTGLDATQAARARTMVSAAQQATASARASPAEQDRAELIVLMTGAVESGLHNWASRAVPASQLMPNDGFSPSGPDHDSIGVLQQRASWGSVADRMTPDTATTLFVTRLLTVPSWSTIPPGIAAQAVQISGYPDKYAQQENAARAWLDQIEGTSRPAFGASTMADCGSDGLTAPPGGNGATVPPGTVPTGYEIPDTATEAERVAVTFALAQLGKPYVFDAAGPDAYDCSGLTMAAWAAAGYTLPHYSAAQWHEGTAVADTSLLSPGDLILIPGSDGSLVPPNPQHVGMYIGDNWIIEAPQTGEVVKIVPLSQFGPIIGMRHIA